MTLHRKLHCSNPKCPHETKLKFSDWIRENLPSSEDGFMVSDVDFILYNYKTKRMMFIEQKQFGSEVKEWQKKLFTILNDAMKNLPESRLEYKGFHLITFEQTDCKDGKIFYDYQEVSENDLRLRLTF